MSVVRPFPPVTSGSCSAQCTAYVRRARNTRVQYKGRSADDPLNAPAPLWPRVAAGGAWECGRLAAFVSSSATIQQVSLGT